MSKEHIPVCRDKMTQKGKKVAHFRDLGHERAKEGYILQIYDMKQILAKMTHFLMLRGNIH